MIADIKKTFERRELEMELTLLLPYRKVVFHLQLKKLNVESVPYYRNYREEAREQALELARQRTSAMYSHRQVW